MDTIPSSFVGLPELHRPIVADEHQAHLNTLLTMWDWNPLSYLSLKGEDHSASTKFGSAQLVPKAPKALASGLTSLSLRCAFE